MSFLINWELLSDGVEADRLREFLNARFQEIERPAFLGPLSVTELDFGDIPPEIAIVDICDPAPEFYLPDDDASETWEREESIGVLESEIGEGTSDAMSSLSSAYRPSSLSDEEIAMQYASNMRRESDAQVEVEVIYKGNMRLAISTELIVNQPTPAFMVLPLTLTLTGFHFTATAIIAYLGDHMNFCFKEPNAGSAILHDLSIDSEVGDKHKQILKNVGRIEKFIVEQLRKVIQDYLVLPNYQSLSLIHEGDLEADDSYDHAEHFIGESAFSDRNA
ncbi:hypothetical protein BC832DRAFT_600216 [Gaertneriomyces semiglobifer]|nr:hypothetical protein BC832DRAFT_600216 [Gaertneriomyces semiglobifer]